MRLWSTSYNVALGVAFIFFKKKSFSIPIYIWILVQIPVISKIFLDVKSGKYYIDPIFDLSQWVSYNLGFHYGDTITTTRIEFNTVAIAFWIMFAFYKKQRVGLGNQTESGSI